MKTNRRSFIKTLTGFSILPISLSFGKNKKRKIKNIKNYNHFVGCSGGFDNSAQVVKNRIIEVIKHYLDFNLNIVGENNFSFENSNGKIVIEYGIKESENNKKYYSYSTNHYINDNS